MTKYSMVTHVVMGMFLAGKPRPHPMQQGPSIPNFRHFLHACTQCIVIKLDKRKIITRSILHPAPIKNISDTNHDTSSFCCSSNSCKTNWKLLKDSRLPQYSIYKNTMQLIRQGSTAQAIISIILYTVITTTFSFVFTLPG